MEKMTFVDFRESQQEMTIEEFKAAMESDFPIGVSQSSTLLVYNKLYFIEKLDDGTYSLPMNRREYTAASLRELKMLELRLFNWAATECDFYEDNEYLKRLKDAIEIILPTFFCDLPYDLEIEGEDKKYILSNSSFTIEITTKDEFLEAIVYTTDNYTDDIEDGDEFSILKLTMYSDFEDFLIPFLLQYVG